MALEQGTGDSLFGSAKKKAEQSPMMPIPALKMQNMVQLEGEHVTEEANPAKWQNLDKVTVLLASHQKEGLDRIAKKLMKHRSKALQGVEEKERITANMLIRAMSEVLLEKENNMDLATLASEKDVIEWLRKNFS